MECGQVFFGVSSCIAFLQSVVPTIAIVHAFPDLLLTLIIRNAMVLKVLFVSIERLSLGMVFAMTKLSQLPIRS